MPIRLALTSSPITIKERYGLFSGAANTEPSFGLVCLAAVAQSSGAEVIIVEASSHNLSVEQTRKEILKFEPDLVGITATTAGIFAAGALAQALKEARPRIINLIGGCHATALPEETLLTFPGFDADVIGEGEETLKEILNRMNEGDHDFAGLSGTAIREGEKLVTNPSRALIRSLDDLPLPSWSLVEGFPFKFRPSPARIKRWPCASIVLTRGCPNQCVFCDRSVFGNRCRAYSPAYAIDLMKDLRYHYGVKEILIEDDTFIVSRQRVQEFCERIISEKIDITWSCLGRADRVNLELLSLMRRAGCWHISYGIESGDPGILEGMKKNLDIEQIKRAIVWSKEAGLYTKGFFMVGFPKESEATLFATLSLAKSLALDDISVMQLTPFPGSQLYETAEQYGQFERDWRKMNTIDTVFIPQGFSKKDLEAARAKILRQFYLRPSIVFRQVRRIVQNPRVTLDMFKGFLSFIRVTGIFSKGTEMKRAGL
jgi:anaerobic magnesium-protoporphyrin IX monomethyl ester cyclase